MESSELGIMGSHQMGNLSQPRIHQWMNYALFGTITIELCLLIDYSIMQQDDRIFSSVQNTSHILSLSLLMLFVALRFFHQTRCNRLEHIASRQTQALVSLLATVKHELNNDMQVVVGNAELAEIQLKSGKDLEKSVSNIRNAVSAAIVRIEQLSVFNCTNQVVKTTFDLNAILRQHAAQMTEELPLNSNLQLELDYLPERITIDAHLFALSITHLIFRAKQYMDTGYDVVLRTAYLADPVLGSGSVCADVIIIPKTGKTDQFRKTDAADLHKPINVLLSDAATLIGLSGALSVRHDYTDSRAQINILFRSEGASVQTDGRLTSSNANKNTRSENQRAAQ